MIFIFFSTSAFKNYPFKFFLLEKVDCCYNWKEIAHLLLIIFNLINQIFQMNFYFIVMKTLILKQRIANYLETPSNYVIIYSVFLAIIAVISHFLANFDTIDLILSFNGGIEFIINILIPGIYFIIIIVILFLKLGDEELLSIKFLILTVFTYLYCCSILVSFYKTIFKWGCFF